MGIILAILLIADGCGIQCYHPWADANYWPPAGTKVNSIKIEEYDS